MCWIMKIDINGSKLFIDVYGSALRIKKDGIVKKPTLIVLHGAHGFADHTLYVEFWSQLQDIAQVIFVDQHGCGQSAPGTETSWNLTRWASDVQTLCQTLEIEKPILAGVSMGGHVICEAVKQFGKEIGGIIFCTTEAKMDINALADQFRRHGHEKAAETCLNFYNNPCAETFTEYKTHGIKHYAKNAYTPQEMARCGQHHEVFFHFARHQMQTFDYRETLKHISCPTLLLAGGFGSHTPEAADEMAANIPGSLLTYKLFSDAGAPVYKDKPELSEIVVREWLIKWYCNK